MRIWYHSTKNIIMVNYPMVMRFSMTDQIVSWGCLLMLNILSHLLPLHNLTVNLTLREINASTYEWHTACPFGLRVFDLPPLSDTTYTHKDLRWSFFVFIYMTMLRNIACIFTKPILVWIRLLCKYNYKCVLRDDFTKAVGRSYLILMAIDWRKFCNIERNTKCINVSMYHYPHQQLYSWGGSI